VILRPLIGLIEDLAELFERLGLRYAFGGALANNYWGIVRATQDADCLVLIPALLYQAFADELVRLGFVQRDDHGADVPLTAIQMRQEANAQRLIRIFRQDLKAELFVPFLPLQDEILRRAVRLPLQVRSVLVTTAEDLILLKMVFRREKDIRDIRGMLWVQRGKLDLEYVRGWSIRMLEDQAQQELEGLIQEYPATAR
jgi:predicted nucleotidyltransferase